MTLLNVERIKLFSTRSPYWCLALIPVIGIGITFATSFADGGSFASLESSQAWVDFSISVVMVMAALSITTEYRFGTIRNSFLAAPKRLGVIAAKALLVAGLSFLIVELTVLITYFLARGVHGRLAEPGSFSIDGAGDWRQLWGAGVIAAIAAVLAIAVGTLIRQSAGAIAVVLLWPLLLESLFPLFGDFGRKVAPWLPFSAGRRLRLGDTNVFDGGASSLLGITVPNWWQGGLVFAGTTLLLLVLALVLVKRRDA